VHARAQNRAIIAMTSAWDDRFAIPAISREKEREREIAVTGGVTILCSSLSLRFVSFPEETLFQL